MTSHKYFNKKPFDSEFFEAEIDVGLKNLNGPRLGLDDHSGQLDEDVRKACGCRYILFPVFDFPILVNDRL